MCVPESTVRISHIEFIDDDGDVRSSRVDSIFRFWKFVKKLRSNFELRVVGEVCGDQESEESCSGGESVVEDALWHSLETKFGGDKDPTIIPLDLAESSVSAREKLSDEEILILNSELWGICTKGSAFDVAAVIKRGGDVLSKNVNGSQPIHFASVSGNVEVIKLLLSLDCDVHALNLSGFSPLHFAVDSGSVETVLLLLSYGADMYKETAEGYSPLVYICGRGTQGLFTAINECGTFDVNWKNSHGLTLLHILCQEDGMNPLLIEEILDLGADIELVDDEMRTPLLIACMTDNTIAAQILLRHGAEANVTDKSRSTCPLSTACGNNNFGLVVTLIECKATHTFVDPHGNTCLHIAASAGSKAIIKYLLECGASLNALNANSQRPLDIAFAHSHLNAISAFKQFKSALSRSTIFLNACAEGDLEYLHNFFVSGSDPKSIVSENGSNGMHIACVFGQIEVATGLADCGIGLNDHNMAGQTPFLWCCEVGQVVGLEWLFSRGVDINQVVPFSGNTGLHLAAFHGQDSVVDWLLRHRVDLSILNNNGDSALTVACNAGNLSTSSLLSRQTNYFLEDLVYSIPGVSYSETTASVLSPVATAMNTVNDFVSPFVVQYKTKMSDAIAPISDVMGPLLKDAEEMLSSFSCLPTVSLTNRNIDSVENSMNLQPISDRNYAHSMDLEEVPKYLDSALHRCAVVGDLEMMNRILTIGNDCNIDSLDSTGTTALYVACNRKQTAIASFLLSKGASLTYLCPIGETPLHCICKRGLGSFLSDVLEDSIDVDVEDSKGNTPLHVAAALGFVDVCSTLVSLGSCAVNRQDANGKTAAHIACEEGHFKVVVLLADHYTDFSVTDNSGCTPFLRAITSGKLRLCKFLKGRGVDVNVAAISGNTALHIACQIGFKDLVDWLVEIGINLTTTNKANETAADIADAEGFSEISSFLVSKLS